MVTLLDYPNNNIFYLWFQFAQPALGLPSRDYFLDPRYTNVLENYKKQAIRTAMAFDNPPNRLLVVRDIVAMVDFEISLANVCLNIHMSNDFLFSKTPHAQIYALLLSF